MRITSAIIIFGLIATSQTEAAAIERGHWYLPGGQGKWCAYGSNAAWQKASDDNFLFDSASATVVDGKVQSLTYFRSGESGDWAVIDEYAFKGGEVTVMTRTYNSFEKGRVVDTFVKRGERLVRTARRFLTLDNTPSKPEAGVDYDAHMSTYAKLNTMPFYAVVFDKPKAGAICK